MMPLHLPELDNSSSETIVEISHNANMAPNYSTTAAPLLCDKCKHPVSNPYYSIRRGAGDFSTFCSACYPMGNSICIPSAWTDPKDIDSAFGTPDKSEYQNIPNVPTEVQEALNLVKQSSYSLKKNLDRISKTVGEVLILNKRTEDKLIGLYYELHGLLSKYDFIKQYIEERFPETKGENIKETTTSIATVLPEEFIVKPLQ
jgi:hypothetical protein